MYEKFYGLSAAPFQLNPDPAFFFGSRGHSSAYSYLKFGVFQGEGFIVVTGEIGAGKTTLVRALLEELDDQQVVAAQLVSTQLDANDLLRAVAVAFGLPVKSTSKAELIATLEAYLTLLVGRRQRALLIVDEAQNLAPESLEELRMLSNFQLGERPLLQSFLVGQPELRDRLRSPSLEQLRQRVIASYHLGPMDEDETRAYVEHRLKHVGWNGDPSFADDAFHPLYAWSRGLPRKINMVCNRVLLASYLAERHAVEAADVEAVVQELRVEFGGVAPARAMRSVRRDTAPTSAPASSISAAMTPASSAAQAVQPLGVHEEPTHAAQTRHALKAKRKANDEGLGPLLCVVGARPNFMKMAPLLRAIDNDPRLPSTVLVHTGQHYDAALSGQLFADLELPQPDVNLEVGSGSHAVQTAEVMKRFEPVLDEVKPSAVIVVGDVNSTLACSLVASKKGVRVVHVEAGLRSFDRAMPEEINRILTDQLSDLLYTTERSAHDNLAREGIPAERIRFVGNLMIDSLFAALPSAVPARESLRASGASPVAIADKGGYGVITLHRPSNVDDRAALTEVIDILRHVGDKLPLVWPMHPRTRANIERFGLDKSLAEARIVCLPPQGYLEMVGLMRDATLVLTDSGGLQEEATALGVPCLTMRENTERPITIEQGTNTLVGRRYAEIMKTVDEILDTGGKRGRAPEFWDGKTAERIADDLAQWLGVAHTNAVHTGDAA